MSKRITNRSVISVILIVVTLGLVSLGTKLPSLSGVSNPGKPKPRPRAVIQNNIKLCKQTIEERHRLIDTPTEHQPSFSVRHPEPHRPSSPATCISVKVGTWRSGTISRAPPLLA